jgi:hypothetical protein
MHQDVIPVALARRTHSAKPCSQRIKAETLRAESASGNPHNGDDPEEDGMHNCRVVAGGRALALDTGHNTHPRAAIIALLVMASVTAAHTQHVTRDLDLVNHSLVTVASFFASNAGTDRWGEDLLGQRGLQTNHFAQLDLDNPAGGCHYDFKVGFIDGTSVIRRNVDVCERRTYALDR